MYGAWENYLKTGFIGRGIGTRHRYELPVKKEKKEAEEIEEQETNSDQVETATDLAEIEAPLVATMGDQQLAELKSLGSI